MFYMAKYNGPTPKRHWIWSNDESLVNGIIMDAGRMTREEMQRCSGKPLVRKYVDKQGKKRHAGNKEALRASQMLDCN